MGVMWGLISVAIASLAQLEFRIRHDATAIDSASTGVYFRAGRI
ncbi:Uncharacterised protein [Salmonella enterica subsp. enterica serovar Daytona]|uniref:Uncharacterized protein n=1 Tax=Salmonella enterica subsp. enterica serovar Daytona TaxID=1962639 RepID=A0A447JFA5_SALET|nr:Uncharacterised protein [Salmonella enterica subsp. enterica serovar Daytona]